MPDPSEFLRGFNLIRGRDFGGFKLTDVTADHQSIIRYKEYVYHISLHFSGSGSLDSLLRALTAETSQSHVIYGARNPYRCVIDPPSKSSFVTGAGSYSINLTGHSYRV